MFVRCQLLRAQEYTANKLITCNTPFSKSPKSQHNLQLSSSEHLSFWTKFYLPRDTMVHLPDSEEVFVKSRASQVSPPMLVNPVKENLSTESELNLLKARLEKLVNDHKNLEVKYN